MIHIGHVHDQALCGSRIPRCSGLVKWRILPSSRFGIDLRAEPPPDRDHDGVTDAQDQCPDSLEDLDFYDDQDGCLDPDDDPARSPK